MPYYIAQNNNGCGPIGVLILIGLGIACIIISRKSDQCDNTDSGTDLNVSQWLLGEGIFMLAFTPIFMLATITRAHGEQAPGIKLLMLLSACFALAWFIVGGVILFRSNIDCIEHGLLAIFATVVWALNAANLLFAKHGENNPIALV